MVQKENLTITAVIETKKGTSQKFDFDPLTGYFMLKKVMPLGEHFPFDFGYIPATIGEDGDPLDVVVISEFETFTGCAIKCRVIGAFKCIQTEFNGKEVRNDRFVAVPEVSLQFATANKLDDLPKQMLTQLKEFFIHYNEQAGKKFKVIGQLGAEQAMRLIVKQNKQDRTRLFQLILPLANAKGKVFPASYYEEVEQQLTAHFGGVTIYNRNVGHWKDENAKVQSEKVLIFEVLADLTSISFWEELKRKLEKRFQQQEISITSAVVQKIE